MQWEIKDKVNIGMPHLIKDDILKSLQNCLEK